MPIAEVKYWLGTIIRTGLAAFLGLFYAAIATLGLPGAIWVVDGGVYVSGREQKLSSTESDELGPLLQLSHRVKHAPSPSAKTCFT